MSAIYPEKERRPANWPAAGRLQKASNAVQGSDVRQKLARLCFGNSMKYAVACQAKGQQPGDEQVRKKLNMEGL